MSLDADLRAEIIEAEAVSGPVRTAFAYFALALGATGTLVLIPTLIAMLAARGLQ